MDQPPHVAKPANTAAAQAAHGGCPICGQPILKRPKPLYGVPVCRKCRNALANRRQFAYLVDGGAFWIFTYCVWQVAHYIVPPQPIDPTTVNRVLMFLSLTDPFHFIMGWIMPLAFYLKDGFDGMSPGKRLAGVQVVDETTLQPISFAQSFKRNIVLIIPWIGFIGVILTMMKGKRWGDGWAKTRVVWARHKHKVPFDQRGIACTHCGYDLTGNESGVCPECGNEVNP